MPESGYNSDGLGLGLWGWGLYSEVQCIMGNGEQTDRHKWKHTFPATSLTGDKIHPWSFLWDKSWHRGNSSGKYGRQGNIFAPVCHSVHRGGCLVGGGCLVWGMPGPGGCLLPGGAAPSRTATAADGTHPTGMHSCSTYFLTVELALTDWDDGKGSSCESFCGCTCKHDLQGQSEPRYQQHWNGNYSI